MTQRAGRSLASLALLIGSWSLMRVSIADYSVRHDRSDARPLGLPPLVPVPVIRQILPLAPTVEVQRTNLTSVVDRPHQVQLLGRRVEASQSGQGELLQVATAESRTSSLLSGQLGQRRTSVAHDGTASVPAALPLPIIKTGSIRSEPSKVRGSMWFLLRNDNAAPSLASSSQLGGAQAGVRVLLDLAGSARKSRLALSARLSSPLYVQGKEAGIGLSLASNARYPVELVAERRIALDRAARSRWAIFGVAGVNDAKVAGPVKLDAYLQGGVVGGNNPIGFAATTVSLSAPMHDGAQSKLSVGSVAIADLQGDTGRIDVGPEITVRFRSATLPVRMSAQWRFRVVGNARPASGPALVIGADF